MEILRYTAFSTSPDGGNPAGVVLDARGVDEATMLATAADLGYSETAFLSPREGREFAIRYFSPLAEVPFCGHATIATAVAYAERFGQGPLRLHTPVGPIDVDTSAGADGVLATLVSVPPKSADLPDDTHAALLAALRWDEGDLDPAFPRRVAYAGAWHPVVAVSTRERLAALDYDYPALAALMADNDWTTVQLVHRESADLFHVRDPFPPGGVVEDPATGAAAAALGGYLREFGLVDAPARITLRQGDDLGRPGVIGVAIPAGGAGIAISGTAVPIG